VLVPNDQKFWDDLIENKTKTGTRIQAIGHAPPPLILSRHTPIIEVMRWRTCHLRLLTWMGDGQGCFVMNRYDRSLRTRLCTGTSLPVYRQVPARAFVTGLAQCRDGQISHSWGVSNDGNHDITQRSTAQHKQVSIHGTCDE
jgi:hypothetical protein